MSRLVSQLHYFSLVGVILILPYGLFNRPFAEPDLLWHLSVFPGPENPALVGLALYLVSLGTAMASMLFTQRWLRALTGFCFLTLLTFKFSFGKIDHIYHPWIISSFAFIFFNVDEQLNSKTNHLVVRGIQTWLLLQYFSSGLWKLRKNWENLSWDGMIQSGLEHIAYGVAVRDLHVDGLRALLIGDFQWMVGLGFLFVLVFQFSCGICALTRKGYIYAGFVAIGFHTVTGAGIGIWYWGTTVAALLFLILFENLKNNNGLGAAPSRA